MPMRTRSFAATVVLVAAGCASPPDGKARVDAALAERVAAPAATSAGAAAEDARSEDALVVLALRNSPQFRAALADLGIAEAEWLRAGALPPLTFSMLFPLGPKQLEYAAKFPVDALWLRPKRVAAARRDWEATAETVVQHGLDLARDVRVACADARAAFQIRDVELDVHEDPYRASAEYAERRFRAGGLSAEQVARAQLRSAVASDRREADAAALEIAAARIAELTLEDARATHCFSSAHVAPPEALPAVDALLADALAARPELRAAELALEAAGERAGLARREIFQLVAVFDANGSGRSAEHGPGVELPIPLDGGRASRALSDALVARAAASYETTVQRVLREVREAHARAEAARSAAQKWRRERLPALEAWAERAGAARRNGATDAGGVAEAAIAAYEGRREAALAEAAWLHARAELERAVGHRLALDAAAAMTTPTTSSTVTP